MHIPVLLNESIEALDLSAGQVVVDCTTNRAGHSLEIAKKIGKTGTLICFDLDSEALAEAKVKLESLPEAPHLVFVNKNFREIKSVLHELNLKADAIIADLGLSSQELDDSGRGFTFQKDEPLLMTFASDVTEDTLTAKDIVNGWGEESIADILYGFADERFSRRIARGIIAARKKKDINTTFELVEIISEALPAFAKNGKTNCATKTFQALRMATNDEVGSMKDLIISLPDILKPNGIAAIITFHSTEDRIVKKTAKEIKSLKAVNKKPIEPSLLETKNNPRARSAKLRIYKYEYE
jgi:16S rRNA (cytosine1402-N4)-methyltransferase